MPIYDCGEPDCLECQRAFGPDRADAINRYNRREAYYETFPNSGKPFREGDVVRIKNNDHLGLHIVESCEWFNRTNPGTKPYWLCECSEIRKPVDWSKIPPGSTGIIVASGWRGSADHLIHVR